MTLVRLVFGIVVLCTLLALTGCGERLYTASGKILVDGKPAPEGTIMFCPEGGGRPATGRISPDGHFTLEFKNPGDGLPAGEYKVCITADIWVAGKPSKQQEAELAMLKKMGINDPDSVGAVGQLVKVVPMEYNHVSTTPLKQKVEAKDRQEFLFELTTKKK